MYQRMAAVTHAYEVPLLAQLGHRGRRVADLVGMARALIADPHLPNKGRAIGSGAS